MIRTREAQRRLTEGEIAAALARIPEWTLDGATIHRTLAFPTFAEGIRFVDRVAVEADSLDHHPDIDIRHTRITLALSTHSAGGLTALDTELAARIDRLAG